MQYATIAVAAPMPHGFTYEVPSELVGRLVPGHRVVVPFRRRQAVGYVIGLASKLPNELVGKEVRAVASVLDDEPVFSPTTVEWLAWIARYYCAPIGEVCRAALPARLNQLKPPKTSRPILPREMEHRGQHEVFVLTSDQDKALGMMCDESEEEKPKPSLLHGVTGSGKTEVYLRLFEHLKRAGKQGILLVPEIGLTPQLTARVVERFGEGVALFHSGLTDAQRHHQWERARHGEVDVVVGTRSAVFAPLVRLGAIVVDEEHDTSYKQDEGVLYHARDAAVMRCHFEGALAVMGSATPSVESYANARAGKYHYMHLPERTGGGALPEVVIVDMRHEAARQEAANPGAKHERTSLSPVLVSAIGETVGRGEQAMIFLNRRGYAHFLICEDCGHSFTCPNCDISLAYHRHPPKLLCHYCDYAIMPPTRCPSCAGIAIIPMGRGTERIEMELGELFPKARIARLDRDTVAKSSSRNAIFKKMRTGEIDILVGTQMIAKGHDFPNITLVGIVSADVALHIPDFRAGERTFQLTTQVSGRAGRSGHGARVFVQTYQPEHPSLAYARMHDYQSFFDEEKNHREVLGYPPYARLANVRMSATDAAKIEKGAAAIARDLRMWRTKTGQEKSITVVGPAPAPMHKVRNRFRWQLLIKAKTAKHLSHFLAAVQPSLYEFQNKGLRIAIDVDPVNML